MTCLLFNLFNFLYSNKHAFINDWYVVELTSCPPRQVTETGCGHGGHGKQTVSMFTSLSRRSSHGPALVGVTSSCVNNYRSASKLQWMLH